MGREGGVRGVMYHCTYGVLFKKKKLVGR